MVKWKCLFLCFIACISTFINLCAQVPLVNTQIIMFEITPANSKAVIMIARVGSGQRHEMLGAIDETGIVARNLELGTYKYEIISEKYYTAEGHFTLSNQNETYKEKVTLRSNGANVTFDSESDAEIWINGVKHGVNKWTGFLKAGIYTVECRLPNHRPSQQTISVEEGKDMTIQLTPPTPITGILSITSRPLGANIRIDSKDYGTTPQNIQDMQIGHHTVMISKEGYAIKEIEYDIRENETLSLELALDNSAVTQAEGDGRTFLVGGRLFSMKAVAGGTFTMGATHEQGIEVHVDEKPKHNVSLKDYYLGETEVTQELWETVMGNNPSKFRGDNLPVEQVSWDDCQEFIRNLNEITGQKFRLPTEAEWEYAARGGAKSRGYKYSGSNELNDVAWYKDNSSNKTHAVATKQANELGIYDMLGNVREWCQDWYGNYNSYAQTNPIGPDNGTELVDRGGSWGDYTTICRVSCRSNFTPDSRSYFLGFRLAMDVQK